MSARRDWTGEDLPGGWHVLCKAPAHNRVTRWTCRHACGSVSDLATKALDKRLPCGACCAQESRGAWCGHHVCEHGTHLVGTPCPEPPTLVRPDLEPYEVRPGLCTRCQAPEEGEDGPKCVCDQLWPEEGARRPLHLVDLVLTDLEDTIDVRDLEGAPLDPYDQCPPPGSPEREDVREVPTPERGGPYRDVLLDRIGQAIEARDTRSKQGRVGPSELGGCERRLAYRLAHGAQLNRGDRWRPQVGTAVHAWLEGAFSSDEGARWLTELRVTVGQVGEQAIAGSLDLFDRLEGRVVDWKVVGPTTLRSAAGGHASAKYHGQIQLYGLGAENHFGPGSVTSVSLAFLPSAGTLDQAVLLTWPYDRAVGEALVARAHRLAMLLTLAPVEAVLSLASITEDYCGSCPVLAAGHCPGASTRVAAPAPALRFKRAD